MRKYLTYRLIVIFIIFIPSCVEKLPDGFIVEKEFPNGNYHILTKILKDTLLNDTIRKMKFYKIYNENGDLICEGKYIGNDKIGKQYFYSNSILKRIKTYEFFSKNDIDFISRLPFFKKNYFNNFNYNISYLNGNIVFEVNGRDTSFKNSTFVDINFINENVRLGDTLHSEFKYYDANSYIKALYFYINIPEDTGSIVFASIPGNQFKYAYKTQIKGKNKLSGFVIISTCDKESNIDTLRNFGVYKFDKEYFVY